jgi:hypothetical protein
MVDEGDPDAVAIFEEFNRIPMPDQALTEQEIVAVLDYVRGTSTSGEPPAERQPATEEQVRLGRALFQGNSRFTNNGPTCNSCHEVRGEDVLAGGLLAAELTSVVSRVGSQGVWAIISRPPFPLMQKAYEGRPLTDEEVGALVAFLERADAEQAMYEPRAYGIPLFLAGIAGTSLLLGLYTLIWRKRRKGSVNQVIFARRRHADPVDPNPQQPRDREETMGWIKDIISPQTRKWEEFYRNRFQHDRIVRSTHGVNCTGGCSWQIHVKDGIVTWETQQLDYPLLEDSLPPYEPRGCQRGISFSWYLYSPLRIKYPLIRGALIDAYRKKKRETGDPMKAWKALQEDEGARRAYQESRGKGGFRRTSWDEVMEIMSVANIHTAEKFGPDRVIGFSPIPAMSMLSYAAGGRFLQLFGGVNLSFYDWYCDLPTAFPEIWGEQTDVCESADWYNAKMIADMGACLNMTRTPDCHFFAESRHNGTKAVVFSPDFSQVCKYADQWVPLHAGSDGAFWMATTHVRTARPTNRAGCFARRRFPRTATSRTVTGSSSTSTPPPVNWWSRRGARDPDGTRNRATGTSGRRAWSTTGPTIRF